MGTDLSFPEILQVWPSKTMYLPNPASSSPSWGQKAQAETPSPANHWTQNDDFTMTLMGGTSCSSHILSMKL